MKFSLFLTILASLLIAFTSASAGDKLLDDVDTKGIKNRVLDDLEDDIDDCEDDSDSKSEFVDCVKDILDDYDRKELSPKQKRDIKDAAKDFNFDRDGRDRHNDNDKSGKSRKLLRSA